MAKIPVQRTVIRDGKPHLQTYWEESDPKKTGNSGSALSKLGVSLPGQNQNGADSDDPVRRAWNVSTLVSRQAVKRGDSEVEACIAAGFTPEAALYLKGHAVPNGTSLTDYIYDNELDQAPRPRNGWTNSGGSDDQRKAWLMAIDSHNIPLEKAVEWIDAGFPYPWSGIPALIQKGASPERAAIWEQDVSKRYRNRGIGSNLYMFEREILSDIDLEEAIVWRKAMNSANSADVPLGSQEMEYRSLGFKPDEAARWKKVTAYNTPVEKLAELKSQGWNPTGVKEAMKEIGRGGSKQLLGERFAEQLIRFTPLVGGPKIVRSWIKVVDQSFEGGGIDDPRAAKAVLDAEAWKTQAQQATGVTIEPKDYYRMASLLPLHRDAYIEIMNIEGRENDDREYRVVRAMDLARMIASPSNLRVLQDAGFPLGSMGTGVVNGTDHAMKGFEVFDAGSASPENRDRWMRSVAVSLYWKNTYDNRVTGDDMRKVIDNPDIDPVKLKDALVSRRGDVSPVQLEGLVLADINSAVSDGWL